MGAQRILKQNGLGAKEQKALTRNFSYQRKHIQAIK